jgi:hypothetical protein
VDGVYEVSFPLPTDEGDADLGTYRDAVAERERSADVASLRPCGVLYLAYLTRGFRRPPQEMEVVEE